MSAAPHVSNPVWSLLPTDIEGFDALAELALDLRWSWNHAADEVWRQLDPDLWELTHNPWGVLQTVSRDRVERVLGNPALRARIDELVHGMRQAATEPAWFQQTLPPSPSMSVAYFSMEYMLSEALPIYSGGLGNVAGDQLKAASDLGVPVIARGAAVPAGLLPPDRSTRTGRNKRSSRTTIRDSCPITAVRRANGEWLRLEIALPGYSVWLRAWQVQVGRARLYLLDSNDAANVPSHRGITSELYGGGPELRLVQEIVLGIGGWRLLGELGLRAGRLPSQRRACGLRRARTGGGVHEADRRSPSRSRWRSRGPATCSPPTRRWRPGSTGSLRRSIEQYLGGYAAGAAGHHPRRNCWPSAARTRRTRRSRSTWRTWRCAGSGSGQRRQPAAREGEPSPLRSRSFRAGRRSTCPSATSPTASTCRPGTPRRPTNCGRRRAGRTAGWGPWRRSSRPSVGVSRTQSCGSCAPGSHQVAHRLRARATGPASSPRAAQRPRRWTRRSRCSTPRR